MAWVSPTGNDNPADWLHETWAHDENLDTSAEFGQTTDPNNWCDFLTLSIEALDCNKIRFNAYYSIEYALQIDVDVFYDGGWHDVYEGTYAHREWVEKSLDGTHSVTYARVRFYSNVFPFGGFYEFDFGEVEIVAPTVTTQAASNIGTTTATGNGNVTDNGGENPDDRRIEWGTSSGNYSGGSCSAGGGGTGAFSCGLTGLPTGTTIYCRAKAHNSAGWGYGGEVTFLTKPAAPTSVAATDGAHTDKVVITWTKSTGATGYQVYRDGTPLGWLGDVATHDDTVAGAPTITPGVADASDGTSSAHVSLSLSGQLANNGATHTYKVRARNATGESVDSGTNTGYRGVGALTYQWQRSAADSDADYSNITGATTASYDDTGAPANGQGRYYQCVENATGAAEQTSSSDRGYRWMGEKTALMAAKMVAAGLI